MTRYVSHWGESGERPAPRPENSRLFGSFTITETVFVNCTTESAWQLVSTISRIGEFSPECIAAEWMEGATGPEVGARFEGTNRVRQGDDEVIWIRPCFVTASVPGQAFAYAVGDRYDGTSATEWAFRFEAISGGCCITQTFRHLPDGLSGIRLQADADPERAAEIVASRAEDLGTGMQSTLRTMRGVLEATR